MYIKYESMHLRDINSEFQSIHMIIGTIKYSNDFKGIDSLVCATYIVYCVLNFILVISVMNTIFPSFVFLIVFYWILHETIQGFLCLRL